MRRILIGAASYFGWIPALGILKPANANPGRRNATMILAHVVWGGAYAVTQSELVKSATILRGGPLKDIADQRPARFRP